MNLILEKGWLLKPDSASTKIIPNKFRIPSEGIPVKVPGTVHSDLYKAKLIPDPFYGKNELDLYWIAEVDWIYETNFDLPYDFPNTENFEIVFDGLDTIAEIRLNNKVIGYVENMFKSYTYDISSIVKSKNNLIKVLFESPLKYGQKMLKEHGDLPSALNKERIYLRKAQYSFGWDWGPAFPTMGIWKKVYIQKTRKQFIKSVHFNTLSIEDGNAHTRIDVYFGGEAWEKFQLNINISKNNQCFEQNINIENQLFVSIEQEITNPELWWPNGFGDQNLYELNLQVKAVSNKIVDTWTKKVGIRTVSLKLDNNKKNTFEFVVNNKPIFIKGANWIPADSFLPRIEERTYSSLLSAAKDAHMNMIRVWGGGIYESEEFYETCDYLGLLVWQDFMFACSTYPEHKFFLNNVKGEIEQNIHRLQHHPSIALWCGNNENEWIWYQENNRNIKDMLGYKIFHHLIPNIVEKLDPERPYWPSSPFGMEEDPNDPKSGNRHNWDIWSNWADYTEVIKDKSLFVTEFGFQAPANPSTMQNVLPEYVDSAQNEFFEFHNKQIEGPERLHKFLSGNLPVKNDLANFIYLTQLNQAFALKTCLEHWRISNQATKGSIILAIE